MRWRDEWGLCSHDGMNVAITGVGLLSQEHYCYACELCLAPLLPLSPCDALCHEWGSKKALTDARTVDFQPLELWTKETFFIHITQFVIFCYHNRKRQEDREVQLWCHSWENGRQDRIFAGSLDAAWNATLGKQWLQSDVFLHNFNLP